MTDEPLVVPLTPGSALVRLSQVLGGLQRHEFIQKTLPATTLDSVREVRAQLLSALENDESESIAHAFTNAQDTLRTLYDAMQQPGLWENVDIPVEDHTAYSLLKFPTPQPKKFEGNRVAAVDVRTVIATHTKPERQVYTCIAFEEAANADAYRLVEIRTIGDELYEEDTLESFLPCFRRIRLPIGTHTFRIESRDQSHVTSSEPFTIEVPAL